MPSLQSIIDSIAVKTVQFNQEAAKVNNKSAARRARKLSLEITELGKQYRKLSVK